MVETVLIFGIEFHKLETQFSAADPVGQLLSPCRHRFQVLDASFEFDGAWLSRFRSRGVTDSSGYGELPSTHLPCWHRAERSEIECVRQFRAQATLEICRGRPEAGNFPALILR